MENHNRQTLLEEILQKKAVIFDLDGTLVDSMWMWYDIDVEFLGRYGLECPDDLQKAIEGMGFTETAVYFKKRFNLEESLDEIMDIWIDMSLYKYEHQVPLKKGAERLLNFLKENGKLTAIATSSGGEMVRGVLKANSVNDAFDSVITSDEVPRGKPAPDIYLKTAETLGVDPSECVVFEDVPAGIMAGKAAGMEVCAVEDEHSGWQTEEKSALADWYIYDFDEIFDGPLKDSGFTTF